MSSYRDIRCAVKTANNELLATAINHFNNEIVRAGGIAPTTYLLALDGEDLGTTTTLHGRAGVAKENVTLVERDPITASKLRHRIPEAAILETTMQQFVRSAAFRPGGYNVVYFDWMCTTTGNKAEGSPQAALEDLLRRTDQPYVVLAQTFNMRGKEKANAGCDPALVEPEWVRGTDSIYEQEKVMVCSNLAERALLCGYIPLWNLHFESMYRRPESPSWMMFMCVMLWKIPKGDVPRHHWNIYNRNQVQIKDRAKITYIDLDVFEKVKSEEGAENQPDFAGQTGLDERLSNSADGLKRSDSVQPIHSAISVERQTINLPDQMHSSGNHNSQEDEIENESDTESERKSENDCPESNGHDEKLSPIETDVDDDGFIKMIPTERLQRMRLPGCPEATIWPRCVLPGEPFHEIYCAYREKAVFDAIQLLNTFKIEKQFALRSIAMENYGHNLRVSGGAFTVDKVTNVLELMALIKSKITYLAELQKIPVSKWNLHKNPFVNRLLTADEEEERKREFLSQLSTEPFHQGKIPCACLGPKLFDAAKGFWIKFNLHLDLALLKALAFSNDPTPQNLDTARNAFVDCARISAVAECLQCNTSLPIGPFCIQLLLSSTPTFKPYFRCGLMIEDYVWLCYEELGLRAGRQHGNGIDPFESLQGEIETLPWHKVEHCNKSRYWAHWSGRYEEDEKTVRACRSLHENR